MVDRTEFTYWLIAWVACMLWALSSQRKSGTGAGLVIAYVLQLWVIHWLAAAIYALPWYRSPDLQLLYGLQQSTYALGAFAVGCAIIAPALVRRSAPSEEEDAGQATLNPWLVHTYLVIGIVTYFVLDPLFHNVATIGALFSTGGNILLVALGMECWVGFSRDDGRRSFWQWIGITALLPFLSILTKGFLGYGFAAMLTVFALVASFYRPRWKMVGLSALVGFLALSMYVTYMRDRREIREVVWGQEGYSSRLTSVVNTFSNFELLDLTNNDHLYRIDDRLNQNALVGMAVTHLEDAPDLFANGRTIWNAALGLVPRMIWPDRPASAGSGDLVSQFTGIRFSEETSVGIGHVMEWYVNFATTGVIVGMMLMGTIVGWLDRLSVARLRQGNWGGFVLCWLPGLGLLQVGGSLFEAVSGAVSGLIVGLVVNHFWPTSTPVLFDASVEPEPAATGSD